jgi:hypothetical protein
LDDHEGTFFQEMIPVLFLFVPRFYLQKS